jgi:hypothetical protein
MAVALQHFGHRSDPALIGTAGAFVLVGILTLLLLYTGHSFHLLPITYHEQVHTAFISTETGWVMYVSQHLVGHTTCTPPPGDRQQALQ